MINTVLEDGTATFILQTGHAPTGAVQHGLKDCLQNTTLTAREHGAALTGMEARARSGTAAHGHILLQLHSMNTATGDSNARHGTAAYVQNGTAHRP